MRDVLGEVEKLADSKGKVYFDNVKIPQRDWNRLADKNYFVTINTVSARNVYRGNLLDCVRIVAMQDKTTDVRCSLIAKAEANRK